MREKFLTLSRRSFILAVVVFAISYLMFHHLSVDMTFIAEFQKVANKPYITNCMGNLGVLFLFSSIINRMIANIFYPKEK